MSTAPQLKTQPAGRPAPVQVLKTKAETALAEAFPSVEPRLPGGDWLRQLRRAAIGAFAAEGLPHRRVEEWKFTDLRAAMREAFPLAAAGTASHDPHAIAASVRDALPGLDVSQAFAIFMDGIGVAENGLSKLSDSERPFLAALADHPPAWLEHEISEVSQHVTEATLALNTALFSDGAVLDIPAGREIETPIALIFAHDDAAPRTTVTRNVVRVGKGAKVVLIECHMAPKAARQVNTLTQLDIGEGAEVVHVTVINNQEGSIHLGRTVARLGTHTSYRPFQMVIGEGLTRNDLSVTFRGEHSSFDLGAAQLLRGRGHADVTLVVDHAVPHCTSRELVKNVLADHARGVFQGKVIVRPDAQKTDGKQMAQALMLSPDAEFDSKPELEIYADDVVCGHGSTVAEIDPELVFYLQSRGIPRLTAQAMLIESFAGEAIDKAEPAEVQDALRTLAQQWLAAEAGAA